MKQIADGRTNLHVGRLIRAGNELILCERRKTRRRLASTSLLHRLHRTYNVRTSVCILHPPQIIIAGVTLENRHTAVSVKGLPTVVECPRSLSQVAISPIVRPSSRICCRVGMMNRYAASVRSCRSFVDCLTACFVPRKCSRPFQCPARRTQLDTPLPAAIDFRITLLLLTFSSSATATRIWTVNLLHC